MISHQADTQAHLSAEADDRQTPVSSAAADLEGLNVFARLGRFPIGDDVFGVARELRCLYSDKNSPSPTEKAALGKNAQHTPLRETKLVSRRTFSEALQRRYQEKANDEAVSGLHRTAPAASAKHLMSTGQWIVAIAILASLLVGLAIAPIAALITLNAAATLYLVGAILFRLYLAWSVVDHKLDGDAPAIPADADLPTVTILLPLYRETRSLPILADSISALDYPKEKLDIKLILEADDRGTLKEAERLGLDQQFDFIIVPPGAPQTKPKACNYALAFSRGALTVIYDAEDTPEPDQLKKAAAAFASGPEDMVCVQARLNYYNADENWLTRLFALEYALWFDSLLPALHKMDAPIPLGGTSNIFITEKLRELGGWDPYNVTEDADLGLRIARRGFRTGLIDSTTLEEANCKTPNWLRQRSRWMKGYIQTWFVNMREPSAMSGKGGLGGFLSTHMFIGGTVFSALINPILWAVFAYWLATRSEGVNALFPEPLMTLNLFALLFGNALFIYLAMLAPLKRGWPALSPAALLAPIYWWLTSIAAYKAVWQLITRPWFWEKTRHGVSAASDAKRRAAIARVRAANGVIKSDAA